MCRKLSYLGCLILLLALTNRACAQCNWEGATGSDWFDAGNWAPDYPEDALGVPINISQAGNFDPVVDRTTTAGQRVDISSNGSLTINSGGNVQSNNWYFQGREGAGAPGDSLLTINEGGKLTAGLTNDIAEARVGYHQPGMHVIQMNGGEFSVPHILTLSVDAGSKGHIQLDGGTMSVGGLIIGAEGTFDINGGTLIIKGDVTAEIAGYISEGKITTTNGLPADVRVDYNVSYPGKTRVSARGTIRTTASNPDPSDGQMCENTWATLSWSPGDPAVSHDLYIGTDFDDVNNGAEGTFAVNTVATLQIIGFAGSPVPEGLQAGMTYYWRIDEVNEADPNSPWKGSVWSFSIPPKTAYNPDPADGGEFVDPNATFSWTGGFAAKLHTVYMGTNFDDVNDAVGGTTQGAATYSPGSLELEKVYYWRVDEFDPPTTYKGDIWSFTTPGAVGNPQPANGAANVQMTATLSWTPAENAASHELYFGTDANAVRNATTASPEYVGPRALGAESYDPGKLAWDAAYYWRVDEVYPTETVKGLVWSFTTADFILVDDFESYNDADPPDDASNRIFDKWIDGFGTTTNGALVGNDLPPYAEQSVVHGGAQSMPYLYDNNLKTSEATLTLVYPKDWTEESVTKLSLWFRGASANAADRMFVALGNAAVYHDDASATQITGWNEWVIDLTAFAGVDLTNVNTITIGFGTKGSPAAGGTGTMYFDDIRLYRPVEPAGE
ncbi:MAG: hypothetical protein ISS70_21345 [Phycisphaerae bacterium]|nr:hypothetical protein [Phycisphaerae bacterium]